ncbi:MAG TPA: glycosyltransferase family 2 protein [Candidatus Paceibacterota bacterium]|nr:glycosyltransferase family 2 protein [Verrucomicrobiota bacterium]HSA10845.1 glycosyltransferase family 2 protein [Candidatus Paceibacterota bacterium]
MNETVPSVTVLIAARPAQPEVKAVAASRALDYPADRLEILVARGKQPSVQRNTALRAAHGELIYFLDDDSVPEPANLRHAVAHFHDPTVQMVGGPNVCPAEAPPLEQVFARVLASWLAFGPSRARYSAVGQVRESSEKELILCNLVARRQAMLELGGFNEALYPNEENALMDLLQKRGGKLIYDPQLLVRRRPRSSLRSFSRMLMTYGRGRAEQFRVHPTFGSALNFVPPLFCLYLLALPLLLALTPVNWVCFVPLAVYALAVLAQGMALAAGGQVWQSLAAVPLIVLTHILYGLGFWRGLFTPLKPPEQRPSIEVALETVTL